ncbi:MAG: four helix bundle protein [Alphaproteobacteria bacterium]|nr:four helix bundle protein [Alphaproteobacteria bacterium]
MELGTLERGTLECGRRVAFIDDVEELEVFKLAYRVSLDVHKATLSFPKIEQYDLASQMRRASKSVCANTAEGFAKQRLSKPEFKRFIGLAIGSSGEMRVWGRYCLDLEYASAGRCHQWRMDYQRIIKMLHKLKELY